MQLAAQVRSRARVPLDTRAGVPALERARERRTSLHARRRGGAPPALSSRAAPALAARTL